MSKLKISVNNACPCGSEKKYKKCCQAYHKGKIASNALEVMKSRYSAYCANDAQYIIKTTHMNNPDYTMQIDAWKKDILEFAFVSDFKNLEILEFIDGETEAYVSFKVTLFIRDKDESFSEKSKFLKVNDAWLYHSGDVS